MSFTHFTLDIDSDSIALVTWNSPGRSMNLIDAAVKDELSAIVEQVARIDQLETLEKLSSCHVWTHETVEKRFHYRQPGVWLLVVRVFRRRDPYFFPITPDHTGCKTWVPLDHPVPTDFIGPRIGHAGFHDRGELLLDGGIPERLRAALVEEQD